MTEDEEDKLNQLMQLAMVGAATPVETAGYGTYPVGDQSQLLTVVTPAIPEPTT